MDNAQPRNPNDLLIIHNIDNEDHEWQYDAIRTPLPYFIAAGQKRELPFYIARHGVEKLIDKILQKEGKNHMNPLHRKDKRDQIVLGIKHINQAREKTANELALEELQRQKDADPYEEMFKEREVVQAREAKAALAAQAPAKPFYEVKATPTQPIAPTTPGTDNPVVNDPQKEVANEAALDQTSPERQSVYNFLTTRAHLELTHQPTREKLDAMSVDDIRKEFGAEFPELLDPTKAIVPDTKETLSEPGMPTTPAGNPVQTPQNVASTPTPAPVAEAPKPSIPMSPTAPGAPLLDQQLQQVK